ncbi:MAG TPA: response regulator [Flavobacterium sp.]|nr:response regulator [Flavobacterium sp.]
MEKTKIIFYLDDDTEDLDYFKEVGEELGHTVYLFSEGHDLLEELKRQEIIPDVIFLDVHMPILNGEEILILLKNAMDWKSIPVVMISGAYPKKLIKYFLDAGAAHLLKKTGTNLKAGIESALAEIFKP